MGRGLSELQRTILRLAVDNRGRHREAVLGLRESLGAAVSVETCGADVYYAEVLAYYWGWEGTVPWRENRRRRFSKAQIGPMAYSSALASLSRAMLRLQKRGLVVGKQGRGSRWSGADLTDAGAELAAALLLQEVAP